MAGGGGTEEKYFLAKTFADPTIKKSKFLCIQPQISIRK
jgi:hypothetical protein